MLKSDLRGIETISSIAARVGENGLKSDLRGIETFADRCARPCTLRLKSDLRGIETIFNLIPLSEQYEVKIRP